MESNIINKDYLIISNPIKIGEHYWNEDIIPLVSISCITYNHANFIRDALDGFLMQETAFKVEILIHDDASTDNTAEIIREYESKYPKLIKPIYQKENQYSQSGFDFSHRELARAQGKYIALCEGDDYWIDPLKLQQQVDFLEANPDYGLVYTLAKVYIEKNKIFKKRPIGKSKESFKELIVGNTIPSLTVMFHKNVYIDYIKEIQPIEKGWLMGDYSLWLYIVCKGRMKMLNSISGVYRVLNNSASHSTDFNKELKFIEGTHKIRLFFIKNTGYGLIEPIVWDAYFYEKLILYVLKSEKDIYELRNEILSRNIYSLKILLILLISKFGLFRKALKIYWLR